MVSSKEKDKEATSQPSLDITTRHGLTADHSLSIGF